MLQNNETFAFLAVIGFVTRGSKVTFSGRSAAFSSNQIAIYLALNVRGRKYKYDKQSVCYEEFYCRVYNPLKTRLIFDRFWPIWGIETKKLRKKNNF